MSDFGSAVGFIGLGQMGVPMAERLVQAGAELRAFDVVAAARDRAAAQGIPVVGTLAEAGAPIVILMLPTSAIVREAVQGLLDAGAIGSGALVIDMSSSVPEDSQRLAADLADRGIHLIDAPVSGGVRGAVAGTLTIMAGGQAEHVDAARALLGTLGTVVHTGPIGSGDAVKALNNLLSATHLWVTSEAILAGKRFGVDPEVMLSVFNSSSGRSVSTEVKWPTFISTGRFDSGFALRLMVKDMQIATQLARSVGLPSRLGEDALELWTEAAEGLEPTADHTEVAAYIDRLVAGADGKSA